MAETVEAAEDGSDGSWEDIDEQEAQSLQLFFSVCVQEGIFGVYLKRRWRVSRKVTGNISFFVKR